MRLSEVKLVVISLTIFLAIAAIAFVAVQQFPAHLAQPPTVLPTGDYVALIKVEGTIAYSTSQLTLLGSVSDPESIAALLKRAVDDPAAKAVVLCIDSPGGSAAASEDLYLKVKEAASKKPVVAYIREYGTSGAYMISLPAKAIIASNSSVVGSVGVYLSVLTYSELLEKLGVKVYVIKSGELKDIGSPYRKLTQREAEMLEEMVLDYFELFKQRVLNHRSLKNPDEVFTGRPFTAKQALRIGLVDGVGSLDDAVRLARQLGGLPPDAPVRELKPPRPSLFQILLGETSAKKPMVPSIEVLAVWPPPFLEP